MKCVNIKQTCSSFENGNCKMKNAKCVFQLKKTIENKQLK